MKHLLATRICLFVSLFLIAETISAQHAADTTKVHSLKEVVVSARHTDVEVIPVQTLSGELLNNLSAHSVADALRYFSGVQLKDYGGIGGLKTINVRSMGSQHVGVFYDGVEIDNAQNGVVDLGRYSLDNMEAISLYNGQKSNIFQPAKDYTSASSIYMIAKKPKFEDGKNYNGKFTFKTGAFDLFNPSILWEQKLSDKINTSLNADYIKSSGKYKFRYRVKNNLDGRGGYDTTAVRKNGDIEIFRIEHALFGKIKDGEWRTRTYFYSSERGYPGAVVKEEPGRFKHEDRQQDKNFFIQSSAKKKFSSNYTSQLSGKYGYDYIYYESDTLIQKLKNKYMIHDLYLSSANMMEILPFWSVNISADFQWNKMNSNMYDFIFPQRYSGWVALATSLQWDRLKAQASLLGTFIHESTREEKKDVKRDWDKYTPTLMASYKLLENEELYARVFYKNIFRMPTFNEMHMAYMGSLSSYLKPEYAKQYNIGIVYSKNINQSVNIEGQVDAYHNRIDDKLVAMPTGAGGQFRWTMMNIGLVKINGVDVSLSATTQINKDLKIESRINYTYQKAQDYTPVKVESDTIKYKGQIPYIPWHSGSAIVSAGYKTWNLSYSFIYTGERYTGSANIVRNKIQEWYTHDLAISKSFVWRKTKLRATMEVNNLMNQAYDVVLNYPMPGTNFKFIFNVTI